MNQTAPQGPLRLPDSMSRLDIGPYMVSIRQHYGLSQQDVAQRLHLRLHYVQAMEQSKFENLPSPVYAKGYVHKYAEFLGIDANQVVERCFGPEVSSKIEEHFIPAGAREPILPHLPKKWMGLALAAVALFGLYTVIDNPAHEETVVISEKAQAVPEEFLAPMRRAVMATPRNLDCLQGSGQLSCFFAARATQRWVAPASPPSYALMATGNSVPPKAAKKKKK